MATTVDERERPRPDTGPPRLAFFHSELSGRCRRVEGFVAQVLQRRQNHETFKLYQVSQEQQPELFDRFGVETVPTLVVIEDNSVCGRLEAPKSCREIERFLGPWLK